MENNNEIPIEHEQQTAEIYAIEDKNTGNKKVKFRGKTSIVPGAISLIILMLCGAAGLGYFGYKLYNHTQKIQNAQASGSSVSAKAASRGVIISDGSLSGPLVSIDVENPDSYSDRKCEQPNYIAKNNIIYAVYESSGKQIPIVIKGVVWKGMETSNGVPEGLGNGPTTGNTLYQIGTFLVRNNFNSVRLTLSIQSININLTPTKSYVNTYSNAALDVSSYRALLSSVIRGLGSLGLTVLLDFYYLTPTESGDLWYSDSIHINDIEDAINTLAKDMCNALHWNILGIDLKNAPNSATWGDGSNTDWYVAATTLGNTLLKACPNWLVFIQGASTKHTFTFDSSTYAYRDFDGAGLQGALTKPITLSVSNKIVYAPQYYTPSMTPYFFFYSGGTPAGVLINSYVERDNSTLNQVVVASMNDMFGKLPNTIGSTVVLSAFGGLYGSADAHPLKTSTRVFNDIVNNFVNGTVNLAGGYLWALNPSTSYTYNPADIASNFEYALLDSTWRKATMELLTAIKVMDSNTNVQMVPCTKKA